MSTTPAEAPRTRSASWSLRAVLTLRSSLIRTNSRTRAATKANAATWCRKAKNEDIKASQEPPFEQHGHHCGHAEDEKKNRQLLSDRVAGPRDPDPQVRAGDHQPERDVGDGRQARRVGIV